MPRSPDLAIFVLTTDDRQTDRQTTDKTDHITPCACARGNYCLSVLAHVAVEGQENFPLLH